jgi:hypothetical protein
MRHAFFVSQPPYVCDERVSGAEDRVDSAPGAAVPQDKIDTAVAFETRRAQPT